MGRGQGYSARDVLLSARPRIGTPKVVPQFDIDDLFRPPNPFDAEDMTYITEYYCPECYITHKWKNGGRTPGQRCDFVRKGIPCKGIVQEVEIKDISRCKEIAESKGLEIEIPKGTILYYTRYGDDTNKPTGRKIKIRPQFDIWFDENIVFWEPGNNKKSVLLRDLEIFRS